jgi:hypothetical protein
MFRWNRSLTNADFPRHFSSASEASSGSAPEASSGNASELIKQSLFQQLSN